MLPFIRPENLISGTVHQFQKVLFAGTALHGFIDVIHQTELPALILPGGTVLPCRKFSAALLIGRQDGQVVCLADLVADAAKLSQGVWILPQLSSVNKADRVDHEVGMDVLGIAVGADLHLISRPCFLCKRSCNLMRLLGSDILPGMEGLNVLVEVDAVQFVVGSFRCQEFRDGIAAIAVDAADQSLSQQFIYVYDDKLVFTYNFKEGTETISLAEIEAALCSDLTCLAPPNKKVIHPDGLFYLLRY